MDTGIHSEWKECDTSIRRPKLISALPIFWLFDPRKLCDLSEP